MNVRLRYPIRVLIVATTMVPLCLLAPPVLASSSRSGDLHVTKECSQYTGLAGSFCTILSSNLAAIPAGSRVVYLQAAGATSLDSDIVLAVGPGNAAFGHVFLPFSGDPGVVTFSGGTGKFTHFNGSVVVTPDSNINQGWDWNGTYSFSPSD
jgi:hypothetical protein